MSNNLRIVLISLAIILVLIIFGLISRNKLPIKYSLFWIFSALAIFIEGLFPEFIGIFAGYMGFKTTASLVTGIVVGLLMLITLLLTVIISEQKRKITLLIQEVSILKSKDDSNESK